MSQPTVVNDQTQLLAFILNEKLTVVARDIGSVEQTCKISFSDRITSFAFTSRTSSVPPLILVVVCGQLISYDFQDQSTKTIPLGNPIVNDDILSTATTGKILYVAATGKQTD